MATVPCILQCDSFCDENADVIASVESWKNLKEKALLWRGLDKFGDVFTAVDWMNGPGKQCGHKSSKLTI